MQSKHSNESKSVKLGRKARKIIPLDYICLAYVMLVEDNKLKYVERLCRFGQCGGNFGLFSHIPHPIPLTKKSLSVV